ncbi:two-component sensor histidine kinase [Zafaria cholistanensis]|uniref:histidine kinase n=1 Tax=Zafaria cholistanensis TaxID=1682741 RepID=A0A5A7NQ61_9MICC|nr:HAMP domain-containing sensor histidine kinase [Zafaria cholistanensis]GER22829.1 two-component sensor histidine kinase [Zafaria cholistanensis]
MTEAGSGARPDSAVVRRSMSLSHRLVAALLALLALICMVIGLITHTAMERTLYAQVDQQLAFASARAVAFQRSGAAGGYGRDPLDAPGQASGTVNARLNGGVLAVGGVLDPQTGERRGISQDDAARLAALVPGAAPVEARLSVGPYRLVAVQNSADGTVITGLPLAPAKSTLESLTWTMLLVSAAGLAATGLVGSLIIRRSLRPLERVSAVAGAVAELPLDAGEVRLAQRVGPADSHPGTEAGNVGHALNALLENVESALEVRQRSDAQMRRFVGDASHELRTPLAAIRGYSELVAATEHLSDDGRRSLDRVVEQSRRMGSLVENLLLLARLDEGKKPSFGEVDLVPLVADAVRDLSVSAPGHVWRLDLPGAPVPVHGDGPQLARVLDNLLSNARKHTRDGTTVEAALRRSADGREAVLTVADNGEGIDPEFLPRVFERFARADKARSGSDGTTGLGLPIARAIVEAHNGSLRVASRPGRTAFEVHLPLATPAPPRPAAPPRSGPGPD